MSKEPEFAIVYGALRSGTTLLRLMLNTHPQLRCPNEMDFMFDHLKRDADGGLSYDLDALEADRIYRAFSDTFGLTIKAETTPLDVVNHVAPAGSNPAQVGLLIVHRRMARMLDAFPNTRIIHILRDPRDVARSSIGMGWASDVYHGAQHWIETEQQYHAEIARAHPDQVLTLRYEDLIKNPEVELARVCDFLGVTYTDAMMDYHHGTTYDRPDTSLIEQWRRKMTEREIGWVEGRVGPLLTKSGYAPSGFDVQVPQGVMLKLLSLKNRLDGVRLRIKRYGLRDTAINAIAPRIGLNRLESQAARRIQKKQAQLYLK